MYRKPALRDGWYYLWFRGLHLLCGEEGREQYTHRPSFEDLYEETVTWELDKFAMVQLHPGHPDDTTIEKACKKAGKPLSPRLVTSLHNEKDPTLTMVDKLAGKADDEPTGKARNGKGSPSKKSAVSVRERKRMKMAPRVEA